MSKQEQVDFQNKACEFFGLDPTRVTRLFILLDANDSPKARATVWKMNSENHPYQTEGKIALGTLRLRHE